MEELRTTEILEREIIEDARKKAEKVLKNAENEISVIEKELNEKREKAFSDLEERYRKKLEAARRELESSLPLDMKRKAIEHYDKVLGEKLEQYFLSFDTKRTIELIRGFLEKSKGAFNGRHVTVQFGGMKKADAESLLLEVCPDCTFHEFKQSDSIRGIIVEREDGRARLSATLELILRILLDEKREELFDSLFGGKVSA